MGSEEFTWGHVFCLAKKMFNYSNQKLAEKLKVDRTTIYRHIKGETFRFQPPDDVNVYNDVFLPPDETPETLSHYINILTISLNCDTFPGKFRNLKYDDYKRSILYLLNQASEAGELKRKKKRDTDKVGDSFPKKEDEEQDFSITDSKIIQYERVEGFEEEEYPEIELSEPEYYGKYRYNKLKKSFGMYGQWDSEPLEPDLKEKWGSACITDEFSQCVKDYGIEDFLEIAPSDLLPMRKNVVTTKDVVDHIRNAVRFVDHMIPVKDHMMISGENKEIFIDISNFIHLLNMYLDFLRENSNNPDLFGGVFIFALSGDRELEEKANKYYDDLISRFKDLQRRLESQNECRAN